ncbi:MAG: apolipoprotein N-acyltransferase [Propionibacteriaceae bacterium]|nr:apolipoprotein N-acyltransferase [Propionibacteriaceae bacterium]
MSEASTQPRPAHDAPLPWWALAPVAGVGGLAATLAFQPFNLWPLAFVAVALLAWATRRAGGPGAAMAVGWTFGVLFMFTSLLWQTSIMVLSYAGLSLVMSLFYAVLGAGLHLTAHHRWAPLWGAGLWTLVEWVSSVFPFGGFAWMRLGYTQLDSWLAGFYPVAGAASVTFLVALIGHLLAHWVARRSLARAAVAVVTTLVTVGVGWGGIAWSPPAEGADAVEVGWVQPGAPGGGVYGLGSARTVTFNSKAETGRLVDAVEAREWPQPDFIVWPENSTDMDLRQDATTRDAVTAAVEDAGVPILVGSIYTDEARQERQTVAVWWDGAVGPELVYAKRNLVPFGEWIPFRDFFLPLVPQLAYVGHQSVPGQTPGAFTVTLPDGNPLRVGVAICYEVIYPQTVVEAARGAEVMVVQSSNAMYQGTNQIDQQFAATRVRAAELRREILVVTTSGISGLIGPRGDYVRAPDSIGAHGVHSMPRRTHTTPAMDLAAPVEYLGAAIGVIGLVVGLASRRRLRAGGRLEGVPEQTGQ